LGLSVDAGNKMKDALLSCNFLLSSDVSTGTGRIKYLELSEKGKDLLRQMGHEIDSGRQGGAEHEYWKHRIAELLKTQGYEVELEKPLSNGGSVDIVAAKNGKRMAVEVETGKSDALANIEKDLKAGFNEVVSVATNEAVAERIKAIVQKSDMGEDRRLKICSVGNFQDQS